jgi:hypothetical protein
LCLPYSCDHVSFLCPGHLSYKAGFSTFNGSCYNDFKTEASLLDFALGYIGPLAADASSAINQTSGSLTLDQYRQIILDPSLRIMTRLEHAQTQLCL